jgi:hypothetical protein
MLTLLPFCLQYDYGAWEFQYQGRIGVNCPISGVGLYDLGARFADIDGDGRADALCKHSLIKGRY